MLFAYWQARFLEAAVAYKKKIGFNGIFLVQFFTKDNKCVAKYSFIVQSNSCCRTWIELASFLKITTTNLNLY